MRGRREALQSANTTRKAKGRETKAHVLAVAAEYLVETGVLPAGRVIAEEVGISKHMANIHLKSLRESGMLDA